MGTSHAECRCAECGIEITGVPIVPAGPGDPIRAQVEKLKPTTYLCVECAKERGISFTEVVIGETTTKRD